ncbi:hypothetical protein PYCC9005_004705 [Savitreella phatthalungensis]
MSSSPSEATSVSTSEDEKDSVVGDDHLKDFAGKTTPGNMEPGQADRSHTPLERPSLESEGPPAKKRPGVAAGVSAGETTTPRISSSNTGASSYVVPFSPDDDDPEGDSKIDRYGNLLDGRQFVCKTFTMPGRGSDLFLLATEVARFTGYRDSYLLFNKNKHLDKIMTNDIDKQHMIAQEAIPNSYRNRPIGVVEARSIFKTFGARMILRGFRVRDDYFAQRARDEGFTEADSAHEDDHGNNGKKDEHEHHTRRTAATASSSEAHRESYIEPSRPGVSAVEYNSQLSLERRARNKLRRLDYTKLSRAKIDCNHDGDSSL